MRTRAKLVAKMGQLNRSMAMDNSPQQPFAIPEAEQSQVRELLRFLCGSQTLLVNLSGEKIEFPSFVYQLFVRLVEILARGQAVHLIPDRRVITTQSAARILGMPRTHFIKLLRAGVLPYHWVGNQRRVYVSDVLGCVHRRDGDGRLRVSGSSDE
jgi:excisionase family DNA binding protein